MCAQVLDTQLSRGMSASDSAKVIRHGNTLPNSPRGRLANPPLQQIIQRATAILEVALKPIKKVRSGLLSQTARPRSLPLGPPAPEVGANLLFKSWPFGGRDTVFGCLLRLGYTWRVAEPAPGT